MNLILPERVKCNECPIRHRAVCSKCDDQELAELEKIKSYRSYKAGDPIFWRYDEMTFVASVVYGVASLNKTLEDGRTQTVGLLFPSDFMGRPGRQQIDFDVKAATDLTLCCFDRKKFEAIVDEMPHIAQRLMEIALDELDAAREWMMLLGRKTAMEKTASFLEILLRRSTLTLNGSEPVISLPLNREEIANYLGLTLETVSRQLSKLKTDGVIQMESRREIVVKDVGGLISASGNDADGAILS